MTRNDILKLIVLAKRARAVHGTISGYGLAMSNLRGALRHWDCRSYLSAAEQVLWAYRGLFSL